jgi:hypothetical protein
MPNRVARSARPAVLLLLAIATGCAQSGLARRIVHGSVTCGGKKVARGIVRFVPIGSTQGPTTAARIIDGQYRADNRDGVPLGRHRVEISARRATGKKIQTPEGQTVDELAEVGSAAYAGAQSPLVAEVKADGDGQFDFDVPE